MDALTILGFLGSLGTTELLMVFFVVLLLFGPKQLPQIARTIGKGLRDIRRAANQLKHEVGLDELDEIYPRSRPGPPPKRKAYNSMPESDSDPEPVDGGPYPVESGPEPPPTVEPESATATPTSTSTSTSTEDPRRERASDVPDPVPPEETS